MAHQHGPSPLSLMKGPERVARSIPNLHDLSIIHQGRHRGNAARLSANERVKNRVREIQSIGAERAAVTVQSLIDEAEQARIKAMDAPGGAAAAVSAITTGLFSRYRMFS